MSKQYLIGLLKRRKDSGVGKKESMFQKLRDCKILEPSTHFEETVNNAFVTSMQSVL